MTDQQQEPPGGNGQGDGPEVLRFEVEHWTRPRGRPGGAEYVWARTLLSTHPEAIKRLAYLRRMAMDPDTLPPPGMPRASRLRVIERRVLEEAVPDVPPEQPLIKYTGGGWHSLYQGHAPGAPEPAEPAEPVAGG